MNFKGMDPDDVRKALEGHADILTPMIKKEADFLKSQTCPNCGGSSTESFLNTQAPFSAQSPLPNQMLRCRTCTTEFNPHSGIITKVPTTSEPG